MAKPMIVVYDNNTREDLEDLNNIGVTNLAGGDILRWNGSSYWNNYGASAFGASYLLRSGGTMTGDITMSNASIQQTNYIQFGLSYADGVAEGRLQWNSGDGTLEVGMPGGDVNLQIGQETLIKCVNDAGVTISNGEAVYVSGGQGERPKIKKAVATNNTIANAVVGVATEHIKNNTAGYVTTLGLVRDVNTSGFSEGDILYLSGTTAGWYQNTAPTAPNTAVGMGVVINAHASDGIIGVAPRILSVQASRAILGGSTPYFTSKDVDGALQETAIKGVTNEFTSTNRFGVSGNFVQITWDGEFTLEGQSTRYDDIVFEMTPARRGALTKPDWDDVNLGLLFPRNDTSEYVDIVVQFPHRWKEGSIIYPHVHCVQGSTLQAVFKMDYKWYSLGATIPLGATTYVMDQYALTYDGGATISNIIHNSGITGGDRTISSIMKLRLYRDDNVYPGDMLVDQFDIHIEVDSFGSKDEYIK